MNPLGWITASTISWLICFGQVAHAQSPANNTVRVSPSVSELSVNPGEASTKKFTVANQGLKVFSFQIYIAPYSVIHEDYDASFEPLPGRAPVREWINVQKPTQDSLAPGKYADVPFSVVVPINAKPGGYSLVIFTETNSAAQTDSGVQVKTE